MAVFYCVIAICAVFSKRMRNPLNWQWRTFDQVKIVFKSDCILIQTHEQARRGDWNLKYISHRMGTLFSLYLKLFPSLLFEVVIFFCQFKIVLTFSSKFMEINPFAVLNNKYFDVLACIRSVTSIDHFDKMSISFCLINTVKSSMALIAFGPSGESKILWIIK